MRIRSRLFVVLCLILALSGCKDTGNLAPESYHFHGEHDYFAITGGMVSLSAEKDIFDGGELNITQSGVLTDITAYTATFYTILDGERRVLICNSVIDQTGGTISVEGDLGAMSGDDLPFVDMELLKENLWFELKTTDLSGKEEVYLVQLAFSM